jgi:hypothetical protein
MTLAYHSHRPEGNWWLISQQLLGASLCIIIEQEPLTCIIEATTAIIERLIFRVQDHFIVITLEAATLTLGRILRISALRLGYARTPGFIHLLKECFQYCIF